MIRAFHNLITAAWAVGALAFIIHAMDIAHDGRHIEALIFLALAWFDTFMAINNIEEQA